MLPVLGPPDLQNIRPYSACKNLDAAEIKKAQPNGCALLFLEESLIL